MELLMALKTIRLNGEPLDLGEMFKVADGQALIDRGYARTLTREEAQAILDSYVEYARGVFGERPKSARPVKTIVREGLFI
jgi:hypothetical protein